MPKTFPDLKFLVPGIIPEGLTIAAGRPKIGKSWFLYLLGIAVANGVEALGVNYGVAQPLKGNVLYLALEDGQRRLQRWMTKLIGINPENWPKALELKTDWRRFDQGGIDDIRAWHELVKDQGGNPTLIMIDTRWRRYERPVARRHRPTRMIMTLWRRCRSYPMNSDCSSS